MYGAGAEPCTVRGPTAVQIVDPQGGALNVEVRMIAVDPHSEVLLLPGLGTPSPDAGRMVGRGEILMYWSNWCGPAKLGKGLLKIDMPEVGTVTVPFAPTSLPRCDDKNAPSVFAVEPISAEVSDD